MSRPQRARWVRSPADHQRVIHKYARKIKGGALLRCERAGKVTYETESLAQRCEDALEQIGAEIQYPYLCQHCAGWHLTRQRQQ